MFQWYAAALVLAHRYGRTLVELHPPPLPRADDGDEAQVGNRSRGLEGPSMTSSTAADEATASQLRRSLWSASGVGTASDASLPRLLRRLYAENDPWRRAPLAACGGGKMGCFFHPPAGCGLTWLPPDVAAQVTAAATGAASASEEGADAAQRFEDSIPLLDVAAEEERLRLLLAADAAATAAPLSSRRNSGSGGGGGAAASAAAQHQVVRVDTIARYRRTLLAVTASESPAEAAAAAATGVLIAVGGQVQAAVGEEEEYALPSYVWAERRARELLSASCAAAGCGGAAEGEGAAAGVALQLQLQCRMYCGRSEDLITGAQRIEARGGGPGAAAAVLPAQRIWFPAHQSFLFRPRPRVLLQALPLPQDDATGAGDGEGAAVATVGLHFRWGDAAVLQWRSHTRLDAYVAAAGEAARVVAPAFQLPPRRPGLPWELAVATDSATARAGVAALAASMLGDGVPSQPQLQQRGDDRLPLLSLPLLPPRVRVPRSLVLTGAAVEAAGASEEAVSDAHVHIESWIAAAVTASATRAAEAQQLSESGAAGGSQATAGDYVRHIAATSRPLLQAQSPSHPKLRQLQQLRVFAVGAAGAGDAFPVLAEAVDAASDAVASAAAARQSRGDSAVSDAHGAGGDLERMLAALGLPTAAPPGHSGGSEAGAASTQLALQLYGLTAGVVADLAALSRAHALVGTCLSQVSRAAADLAYAGGRALRPPAGPDVPACRALPLPHPNAVLSEWTACTAT